MGGKLAAGLIQPLLQSFDSIRDGLNLLFARWKYLSGEFIDDGTVDQAIVLENTELLSRSEAMRAARSGHGQLRVEVIEANKLSQFIHQVCVRDSHLAVEVAIRKSMTAAKSHDRGEVQVDVHVFVMPPRSTRASCLWHIWHRSSGQTSAT